MDLHTNNRVSPEPNFDKLSNTDGAMGKSSFELEENGGAPSSSSPNGAAPDTIATLNGDPGGNKEPTGGEEEEKKEEAPVNMVGVTEVFRFSTAFDRLMMVLGTVCALVHGAALPAMIIVFGDMTDLFVYDDMYKALVELKWDCINATLGGGYTQDEVKSNPVLIDKDVREACNITYDEDKVPKDFLGQMNTYAMYYAILGVAVIFLGYMQTMTWQNAARAQCQRIRTTLFKSILRQEIGWFDTHEVGELNTRLSDDVDKILGGIGNKVALFLQMFSAFIAGFVIAFIYGWKLALVIIAVSPLLGISGAVMAKLGANFTAKELAAYAKAGAVAEEVLGAIRTVVAFGGQYKEAGRYRANLMDARNLGITRGFINGGAMGVIYFVMFASYGLAFWYGTELVMTDEAYSAGTLLIVFFSVIIGAFSIGNASPNIQNFAEARGAAYTVFEIIATEPKIDSASDAGKRVDHLEGNIEFKDVVFRYPARPEVQVLNGLNVKANVGQTVALVGPSGCGKSTTVQLLQRFYDPLEGQVLIDGVDLRDYHLKDLRKQIGVVSQEPVLFATTIRENIEYGREGVTYAEIEAAAKEANAHDFIMKLPKKYDTLVGEKGAQLSGGQKQRIAIARALVRNPKILLLDEATSALDTESEKVVQDALDKVRMGRTTIVVAHRLSTIQTADVIVGFDEGKVAEMGTHAELLEHKGIYYTLYTNQTRGAKKGDEDIEEEDELPVKGRGHSFNRTVSVKSSGSKGARSMSVSSDKPSRKGSVSEKGEEEEENIEPAPVKRIMGYNAPEWPFIVIGCIAALINGCVQPAFAVIFANILGTFSGLDDDDVQATANFWSGMFVVIGVVAAIGMFLQSYMFARSGECLTMRMRDMAFVAMLRQDIAFFDDEKNGTGALTTRLATDASAIQGATGTRLAVVIQSLSAIGAGLIIGFVFSWKLTLLILAFVPFIVVASALEMRVQFGMSNTEKDVMEEAGKIATECVGNMRTVATLTKEDHFHREYVKHSSQNVAKGRRLSHLAGLSYGASQGIMFFAYAACFSAGAYLVENDGLGYEDMFKVFSAIVFSAMSVGQASSFAPDYSKAKVSAARIFTLLDTVPEIDSYSTEGEKPETVSGAVELTDVHFNYPTRPDVAVLQGLSISVAPGKVMALVGSSGCGKSTVVGLLERFYNPLSGSVKVDGKPTPDYNIQWLRAQMGIVSQEPVLFDASIAENIAYGDNARKVDMAEIIDAAKNANIHNFIAELPNGYDTNVGDKGTQLSGGQKQRVAIARALLRNPKILLLDEATSALDTESEKIVQEALDKAQEGRTSIVIAHRLSTIRNADAIVCIQNGVMAEVGTHAQLMARQGIYFRLNNIQKKQT